MSKRGITLKEALEKYCPWDQIQGIERLEELKKKSDKLASSKENGWIEALTIYMPQLIKVHANRNSAFLEKLKTGALVATGYDLNHPIKASPVRIPAALWNTLSPNIEKSAAAGGGAKYGGILIRSTVPSTVRTENACLGWFKAKIASGYKPDSWLSMLQEAQVEVDEDLSERAFKRVWKKHAPPSWKQPGRKSRQRIDTQG